MMDIKVAVAERARLSPRRKPSANQRAGAFALSRYISLNTKMLDDRSAMHLAWMRAQTTEHSKSGRTLHWKITARSSGGFILWIGNIHDEIDAWRFWHRLQHNALGYQDYIVPQPAYCPSIREIEGVTYEFATVTSFTATGTTTWTPLGSGVADWLVVAGGGGGATGTNAVDNAGGGGAGGVQSGTGLAVADPLTVVIGAGGASDTNGSNSSLGGIVSIGGGHGGSHTLAPAVGGSGGGASALASQTGAAGTAGQGNAGGNPNPSAGFGTAGGGGGKGAAASGAVGGVGISTSISGAAVFYGGGGGGAQGNGPTNAGGNGGGGASAGASGPAAIAGTANRGGGGGGGAGVSGANGVGAAGGSGIVIVSYTQKPASGFNMPMNGL